MRHVISLDICGETWQVELVPVSGTATAHVLNAAARRLVIGYDGSPLHLLASAMAAAGEIRARGGTAFVAAPSVGWSGALDGNAALNNVTIIGRLARDVPVMRDDPKTDDLS